MALSISVAMRGQLKHIVLDKLVEESLTGANLIKRIKESYGWTVSYGSMYPLLKSLQEENLVTCDVDGKNKYYSITKKGEVWLKGAKFEKKEVLEELLRQYKVLEDVWGFDLSLEKVVFSRLSKGECMGIELTKSLNEFRHQFKELFDTDIISQKEDEIASTLKVATKELKKLNEK